MKRISFTSAIMLASVAAILFSSCVTGQAFYVSYSMYSGDRNAYIEPESLKCEFNQENISIEFAPQKGFIIRNNSDYALIIDLYNSTNALEGVPVKFSNCETTTISTTQATTTSHSRGASTNLGGIARALGVGGAVGAVASSVNVGGGSTNANTASTTQSTTRTEERYLVVAPHSYKSLGHKVGDYCYSEYEVGIYFLQKEGQYFHLRPKNLLENYTSTENTQVEIMEDDRTEMDLTLCYGFENEDDFHYKYVVIYPFAVYYQKENCGDVQEAEEFRIPRKQNMIKYNYIPNFCMGSNCKCEQMKWFVSFK